MPNWRQRALVLLGRGRAANDATWRPSGVYAMRLEARRGIGGTVRRLSPDGNFWQAMIDSAGCRVVFWGRAPKVCGQHLWIARLDGSPAVQITEGPGVRGHPAWFPDGCRVAYFASEADDWQPERQFATDRPAASLRVMDVDTGRSEPLTEGPYVDERPAVSPDGREVVFVSNRRGTLNLWRVSASGAGLRQITHGGGPDYRPAISHDGRNLAYFTTAADRSHQLRLLSWPSGEPLALRCSRQFAWVHGPFWSVDGRTVLVHALSVGEQRARLWMIDTRTGDTLPLELPGISDCSHGTWDQAERWICFDSREPVGDN